VIASAQTAIKEARESLASGPPVCKEENPPSFRGLEKDKGEKLGSKKGPSEKGFLSLASVIQGGKGRTRGETEPQPSGTSINSLFYLAEERKEPKTGVPTPRRNEDAMKKERGEEGRGERAPPRDGLGRGKKEKGAQG